MPTLRLTYAELGARIGQNPEAARALARRRRWRIERGNDGRARVLLDEVELDGRPSGHPPGRVHPIQPDDDRVVRLESERNALQAKLLEATARAARAEGEATALRDALADLAGRLDRAEERLAQPWWRRLLG